MLAAEPGWRSADIAVISRSEGGPAVLREWTGTWTRAIVPHSSAKLWTAASFAPPDCGPMKLAESCVIEQHIDRLLNRVEPTNLGLGTPDAAALVVRTVRGWANDMAAAPTQGQDADVVLPIGPENAYGSAFR